MDGNRSQRSLVRRRYTHIRYGSKKGHRLCARVTSFQKFLESSPLSLAEFIVFELDIKINEFAINHFICSSVNAGGGSVFRWPISEVALGTSETVRPSIRRQHRRRAAHNAVVVVVIIAATKAFLSEFDLCRHVGSRIRSRPIQRTGLYARR